MGNRITTAAAMLTAIGLLLSAPLYAQNAGKTGPAWTPPKKAWGHPDIEGIYTNKDEANTPLERPDGLKGRSAEDFTAAELESLAKASLARDDAQAALELLQLGALRGRPELGDEARALAARLAPRPPQ